MQETQFGFLGWEDPLEDEMATHSSIFAWRKPWTEELGGLQSMGLNNLSCMQKELDMWGIWYQWWIYGNLNFWKRVPNNISLCQVIFDWCCELPWEPLYFEYLPPYLCATFLDPIHSIYSSPHVAPSYMCFIWNNFLLGK